MITLAIHVLSQLLLGKYQEFGMSNNYLTVKSSLIFLSDALSFHCVRSVSFLRQSLRLAPLHYRYTATLHDWRSHNRDDSLCSTVRLVCLLASLCWHRRFTGEESRLFAPNQEFVMSAMRISVWLSSKITEWFTSDRIPSKRCNYSKRTQLNAASFRKLMGLSSSIHVGK